MHECSATASRRVEGDVEKLRTGLGVLELIGHDSQSQRLDLGFGVVRGAPVGHDTGQFKHFGNPALVLLLLYLDGELHGRHILTVHDSKLTVHDSKRADRTVTVCHETLMWSWAVADSQQNMTRRGRR